jgi:alkaline phosphatase
MRRFIKILCIAVFAALIIFAGFTAFAVSNGLFVQEATPKYIFLFVGDGFGYPQMSLASLYKTSVLKEDDLIMNSFKSIGGAYTGSGDSIITDSSAAATALASGIITNNGLLNMDENGVKYETIAEKLKEQFGYKIGVISSVTLSHATPAGFYAHQNSRYNSGDIFNEFIASGFDYFGGGDVLGKPADFRTLLEEKGYQYINTPEEIEKLGNDSGSLYKTIAVSPNLDYNATVQYLIDDMNNPEKPKRFGIAEHTRKCAEILYNDAGFFIAVEGGKIDWACHSNDAVSMIYEVIDFDNAVREAVEFYKKYPRETLIIVTGDHETGGLSLGYSGTTTNLYLSYLENQTISFSEYSRRVKMFRDENRKFDDILPDVKKYFFGIDETSGTAESQQVFTANELNQLRAAYDMSLTDPAIRAFSMSEYVNYGLYDPFTTVAIRILNLKAGISWSTYSHTAMPVPVLALGTHESVFAGFYRNNEIFEKLKEITGAE